MNKLLCCILLTMSATALAQTPPPAQAEPAPRDELEPGVDTSAPASVPQQVPAEVLPEPGNRPAASPTPAAARPTNAPATANKPKGNAKDRLDLESTQITGNRELPKVLYIVPWRGAELGDLVGRPVNSLLDEVLQPVDRDVFRRQNRYFEALQPNEAPPAGKPEK